MTPIKVSTLSRNYLNLPLWVAEHRGMFRNEGLDVDIAYYETINTVYEELRDGHVHFSRGTTEHVILDREQGGHQEIIGGNLNKLPFSLIGAKHIKSIEDLRGGTVGVSYVTVLGVKVALSAWMFAAVQMERRTADVMSAYKTGDTGSGGGKGVFHLARTALSGYGGITVIGIVIFLLSDALKVLFEIALASD